MFDKRLFRVVPVAKKYVAASVVLQWVALVANIALFLFMGAFLQDVMHGATTSASLLWLAGLVGAVVLVRMVCQTLAQRMGQAAAAHAKQEVRQRVYTKLVELGPSYREQVKTSEAVQLSVDGVEQLDSYFSQYLPQLFYALVAPLTLFACLAPFSLPAALVLLACVPLIPLSIVAVQKIAKRIMKGYWGSYTNLGSLFLEALQGLTTLKIYRADQHMQDTMNQEAESFRRATMRLLRMQLNSITVMDLFAFGGAAAGIVVVLSQYGAGAVTFAAAFALVFLSAEFFIPLRTLGSYFHTAMNGMAAADKMFEILDTPAPPEGAKQVDSRTVSLRCRQVSYAYDERLVLSGIDFDAPAGSFIGITGESGSGKSTLAGILTGAHKAYGGVVQVNGVDLRAIAGSSLSSTIGALSYSSYLFKGTVRSNLQMAKPQASDESLWEVLELCRLGGFVRAAGGLDAPVAAEGSNLSGGQRQRLALARTLLLDTPVVLLDEATSNIDAESENAIIAIAHELARTKTVIMITHRLSSLRQADAIYVLAQGRVRERGNHDDLCRGGGLYATLWESQVELEPLSTVCADSLSDTETVPALPLEEREPLAPDARKGKTPDAISREVADRSHLSTMVSMVGLVRPLTPFLILAVVLGVAGFAAAIFLTVFAAFALLDLSGQAPVLGFGTAVVGIVLCGVLRGPLRYGEQLCNHYLAFKVLALVRDRVFSVLRTLAPAKLEGRDKGNLVSLVTSDVELLEVFYAHTISPVVIAFVVSVGMTVFIGIQSPVLGLISLVSYGVLGVLVPYVSSKLSGEQGRGLRDGIGAMNAFVLDSLRGLPETLQFGRSDDRAQELSHRMKTLAATEATLKSHTAASLALIGALVLVFDGIMLAASAVLVHQGVLSFGSAVLAVAALMSSFGPVIAVANLGTTLQQTLASGARVLDLLDEKPQTEEVVEGVELSVFDGAAVKNLSFAYAGDEVLKQVSVNLEAGAIVRLAGRSGSGKSTLLKLLMRFWDAEQGVITVAGHEVKNITTECLRQTEGFMTQDTHLFAGTIRENLMLAKRDATEAELAAALEKAALLTFVERLPHGLDSSVGELGSTLSGGERQRLGLARVFLHDAPLLLLDEPTSNLDSLNEALILQALAHNREGKTVVLVSHRASAGAIADKTYSVDRGRLS